MAVIDAQWFRDRMSERSMSQRGLADRIGADASSLSLLLAGKRRMTAERAAAIARELGTSVDEVLLHAGVPVMDPTESRVPIIGSVDGSGRMTPEQGGSAISPLPPVDGSGAVVMRTAGTGLDYMAGWVAFTGPPSAPGDSIIDRTVIATVSGAQLLRLARRGSSSGVFTLTGFGQPPVYDVVISESRVVALFRPI